MALSKALVKQFQALYLEKYGVEIDAALAEVELRELAELVRITSPKQGEENEVFHDRGSSSSTSKRGLQG